MYAFKASLDLYRSIRIKSRSANQMTVQVP